MRRILLASLLATGQGSGLARAQRVPVLGPVERVADLRAAPGSVYAFIVRGDDVGLDAAKGLAASDPVIGSAVPLPLIGGVALALKAGDADALARRPGIVQVWYLPRRLFGQYVRIIQSFQYVAQTAPPPMPINLSQGPPPDVMPMAPHLEEPMNVATKAMADKGYVLVLAAGNYYTTASPNPGVISPWCLPEWVICVGAAKGDMSNVWGMSARGTPGDPSSWPDVVANGVDVLSTWPKGIAKSFAQRQQDQASAQFRALPKALQGQYAVMSGTSQATPQVTRATTQILYFIQQTMVATQHVERGETLFAITIPLNRGTTATRAGPRLTGDVGATTSEGVEVTYRVDQPWRLVKQLLQDTAVPVGGHAPNEVGAGFVSPEYIEQQFGQYGVANAKILPIKAEP